MKRGKNNRKKMKPYHAKKMEGKFEAEVGKDRKYATKKAREEARNANRSLKKSERQRAKNEIKKKLEDNGI